MPTVNSSTLNSWLYYLSLAMNWLKYLPQGLQLLRIAPFSPTFTDLRKYLRIINYFMIKL